MEHNSKKQATGGGGSQGGMRKIDQLINRSVKSAFGKNPHNSEKLNSWSTISPSSYQAPFDQMLKSDSTEKAENGKQPGRSSSDS